MSNEISLVSGESGVSHNGIFRGKDLGTISSLNEYIAFRTAHGIDDRSYKDLYLGDYFKIQDGTYNSVWMVAHFDYFKNYGPTGSVMGNGIVLIPRTTCGTSKMKSSNDTTGGYKGTIVHNTVCPAIGNALKTVLGSYLLPITAQISNTVNTSMSSMAGAGWVGAVTGSEWVIVDTILPNETQMYGSTIFTTSCLDAYSLVNRLVIFNFINPGQYGQYNTWLSNVASTTLFASVDYNGRAGANNASASYSLRPLIYIG